MVAFIDSYKSHYGVESICRVLPITPATHYVHRSRQLSPDRQPKRVRRDAMLKHEIKRVFIENHNVYGARKIWLQMKREGFSVARCTIERLMRTMGLSGVVRGKKCYTTVPQVPWTCVTLKYRK